MSQRDPNNRGFTMAELMVSLGVVAILAAGLGSAILVSTRALPSDKGPAARLSAATPAINLLTTELYYAQSFTRISPTSVSFTVAPRGSDSSPETITYSWSGSAGAPLTRQYNNKPPVAVVSNISGLTFGYNKLAKTTYQTVTSTTTTPEQLVASFTGWPLIAPSYRDFAVSSSKQISEYFKLSATPPAGATALNLTHVSVQLKGYAGGSSSLLVGLYKPTTAPVPSNTALAGPVSVSTTGLGASYQWVDAYFSSATVTDLSQDYCLGVFASTGKTAAYVQYLYSPLAPNDTDVMQTWSNGSWGPSTNTNQQDMPFYCYGTWTVSTATQQPVTDYYLQSVDVQVQLGSAVAAPLVTSVEVYGQPKVTGL